MYVTVLIKYTIYTFLLTDILYLDLDNRFLYDYMHTFLLCIYNNPCFFKVQRIKARKKEKATNAYNREHSDSVNHSNSHNKTESSQGTKRKSFNDNNSTDTHGSISKKPKPQNSTSVISSLFKKNPEIPKLKK